MSLVARIYIETYIGYTIIRKNVRNWYKSWIHPSLTRIYLLARALNNGFWLGVLDKEDLESIDYHYYSKMQKGYHDIKWNLKGLFDWEKIAIDAYYKGCHLIMVAGAGAGREVIALERTGYSVNGFECNPDLVRNGNEILEDIGSGARLQLMPRNECPEVAGVYDGVIIGWSAYLLVQGKKLRIKLLRGLHEKIKGNGPLLISFYPRLHGKRYYHIVVKFANGIRYALKRRPIEVGDDLIDGCHYGHYFTEQEIMAELREAGFQLVQYRTERYNNLHNDKTSVYGWAVGIKT